MRCRSIASLTGQMAGWALLSRSIGRSPPTFASTRSSARAFLPPTMARLAYYNRFAVEFWRFVLVQQEVGRLAQTAIEFPPMQKSASLNLEAVKEQIEKSMQSRAGK